MAFSGLPRWAKWALGSLAGLSVLVAAGGTALAQGLIMNLLPVEGSGISGSVTLDPQADGTTRVTVRGRGLDPSKNYFSPSYGIASAAGTCSPPPIGAPSASGPGTRTTWSYTVPAPIDDIFAVSIREVNPSPPPPGLLRACADRRVPAALPRTGEVDLPLWIGGAALVALILAGAGIALRRRAA